MNRDTILHVPILNEIIALIIQYYNPFILSITILGTLGWLEEHHFTVCPQDLAQGKNKYFLVDEILEDPYYSTPSTPDAFYPVWLKVNINNKNGHSLRPY